MSLTLADKAINDAFHTGNLRVKQSRITPGRFLTDCHKNFHFLPKPTRTALPTFRYKHWSLYSAISGLESLSLW